MCRLLKVFAVILILYQCNEVFSKKYYKILTFDKEPEHGVLLHHLRPISFIKESITPFGKFIFRHSVEKRDVHKRKSREIEDLMEMPNVEIDSKPILESPEKKIFHETIPTDVILARVEFYKAKPIEAIDLHSSSAHFESNQDLKIAEITPIAEISTSEDGKENIPEAVSLTIPEHKSDESNAVEEQVDAEEIKSTIVDKDIEASEKAEIAQIKEEKEDKEIVEPEETETETLETASSEQLPVDTPQSGDLSNREVEGDGNPLKDVKVEESSDKAAIVKITSNKPVEIAPVAVSPLPQPIYIPLYTEVKTPEPIPVTVQPITEAPVVVTDEVNVGSPVVVITEKVDIVPPPPPPPPPVPVETVTTVVESTQTPSLFTRGSRFMLNISSRILKKMLRLISMARTRFHLGEAVDE